MLRHRCEAALRRFAIAAQLGGLSIEQQRERLLSNQPAGVAGVARGCAMIAGTDRQQPMGEGVVAARFAASACRVRRAHQRTQIDHRAAVSTATATNDQIMIPIEVVI